MDVEFTKMHAAGNDFMVVDETAGEVVPESGKNNFVARYCRRHFGVGADGAIFIQKSDSADLKFHFFNPDGSIAEMCGNGIRCLAKYAFEKGLCKKNPLKVETLAGILTLSMTVGGGRMLEVSVDMGAPRLKNGDIPVSGNPDDSTIEREVVAGGFEHAITAVGMGNPHAVLFQNSIDLLDVLEVGARIRNSTNIFPKGVNVHFVEKISENEFGIRTYERGVEAETLACGTG
ncbi:MAG TPA: diaminopimelate epimerase, partial [Candidatus Altiarchaeales archaeon]|nr:diaminopimelate epimerase [Candidatus Altiarchaeales archaeon]